MEVGEKGPERRAGLMVGPQSYTIFLFIYWGYSMKKVEGHSCKGITNYPAPCFLVQVLRKDFIHSSKFPALPNYLLCTPAGICYGATSLPVFVTSCTKGGEVWCSVAQDPANEFFITSLQQVASCKLIPYETKGKIQANVNTCLC